jgi:DNA-directed RNA polymerase omega subunit
VLPSGVQPFLQTESRVFAYRITRSLPASRTLNQRNNSLMSQTKETTNDGSNLITKDAPQSKTGSRYQLSIVAGLRAKQLMRGALPRVEADLRRRRNTSIAIEEVKQGRITFKTTVEV